MPVKKKKSKNNKEIDVSMRMHPSQEPGKMEKTPTPAPVRMLKKSKQSYALKQKKRVMRRRRTYKAAPNRGKWREGAQKGHTNQETKSKPWAKTITSYILSVGKKERAIEKLNRGKKGPLIARKRASCVGSHLQ